MASPKLIARRAVRPFLPEGPDQRRIDQKVVRELFSYRPRVGVLTWRPRPRRFFKSDRDCSAWNSNFANKPFGGISWWGYIQGHCLGGKYFAHTLLFLWMRGRWPVGIDHDDRDRTNNRWKNLIEAGALANSRNIRRKKERVGVYRVGKRFIATIKVSGKRIRLGLFGSYGEAVAARIRAEKKYGFRNG